MQKQYIFSLTSWFTSTDIEVKGFSTKCTVAQSSFLQWISDIPLYKHTVVVSQMEACGWKPPCDVPTSDHMWVTTPESWPQNWLVGVPGPRLPPEPPPAQQPCQRGPAHCAEQQPQLPPAPHAPPWACSAAPTQRPASDYTCPHDRGGHHFCSHCRSVAYKEKCWCDLPMYNNI